MHTNLLLSLILFGTLLSGCVAQLADLSVKLERWRSDLNLKTVNLDALTITYLEGGNGPTVLMIHGFGGDKDHWTRMSRYLTAGFHVIAIDVPGFGESSRIDGLAYNSGAQAERIEKFRDRLGIESMHLIGNSMGGMIATAYAHRFPQHTQSLTLLDSGGIHSPDPSDLHYELESGRNPLLIEKRQDLDTLISFSFVNPPYIPSPILDVFYERSAQYRKWNSEIFKEISDEGAVVQKALPSMTSPLLVIWGKNDRILDVSATQVIAEIRKDAKIHILDQCGHAPMLEKPETTAKIFVNFVKAIKIAVKSDTDKAI